MYSAIPGKPLSETFSCASPDGSGIFRVPNWSSPPPGQRDLFGPLRTDLQLFLLQIKAPAHLSIHASEQRNEPLLSEGEVEQLRALVARRTV